MGTYLNYWARMVQTALTGSAKYLIFIAVLAIMVVVGAIVWIEQLHIGLQVTHMSNEVPWGLGIANFVYFVGVGDAVVILMVPVYIYHNKDLKDVVLVGLLLAVVSVLACLLFIFTDIGRPERFLHLMPGIWKGILNLPSSMLAWDVLAFNGYLVISLHKPGYLLYKMYLGQSPRKLFYLPFVFVSIVWAIIIHTVTAFLLSGLGVRAFWNTAITGPRFLISAFAYGPAFLILIFHVLRKNTKLKISDNVFDSMRRVMTYTLMVNLFIFACVIFNGLYTNNYQSAPLKYLLFGFNGRGNLIPYIWTAIAMQTTALLALTTHRFHHNNFLVLLSCWFVILGIWVEKGMGLIYPGFIPTPLGTYMEYQPSWHEVVLCISIFCLGALLFTMMTKIAIAIQVGDLRKEPLPIQEPAKA